MANQESQLNITEEELERFQKAMKNEEFRKMFSEYAQEISNPENKKKYEEEIAQLEAERGMDVKFINPQDGLVVKTSIKSNAENMKAFINICQSDAVTKATCEESNKTVDERSVKGQQWSIPYSLNQPREDLDKAGKKCKVYDVIFHTETYKMGQEDPRFKQLIFDTAFDAIERNWSVKVDRKNLKYPKIKFKGTKTSSVIRTANDKGVKTSGADIEIGGKKLPYPYKDKPIECTEKTNEASNDIADDSIDRSSTPEYSIVHRGHLDLQNFTNARDSRTSTRPQELVVNIELPLCATSSGVDLDIFEKKLILDSSDPKYHLDVTLPYPVNEDEGRAQFDKSKRRLIVTLPVIPAPPAVLNGYADSEAADTKGNGLVTEIADGDQDCSSPVVSEGVACSGNSDSVGDHSGGNVDEGIGVIGDDGTSTKTSGHNGASNCEIIGDKRESGGSKNIENGLNNLQADTTDVLQSACTGANEEQRTKSNSGVTCPVFTTPPYSFHQNNECVTFVLHVPNVSLDTMSLGFNGNKCCINFPSTSITATDFLSPGYALHVQFPNECLIDSEKSTVDLNETNLVVVLYKKENCVGMWQWCMIGSDESTLQKKLFLTEETLKDSLNEVKDEWQVNEPITLRHKIESCSDEESVIRVDIRRENSAVVAEDMGNVLTNVDDILFSEVKDGGSDAVSEDAVQCTDNTSEDLKRDTADTKNDPVIVNHADLKEVEVIDEIYDDNDVLNEPTRLSTVQEDDLADEVKNETTSGNAELQKARAIKCRKNRRRRRRSTGSHDQSSSVSEDDDGSTRRGKQREKHARRSRMSRSLSFGSSADSHDDYDAEHNGHRVRFNPVPEVHVFSNRADKRKWKELRKQQLLNGSSELERTQRDKTNNDTICKLKSSLKDTRSSASSDDGNAKELTKDIIGDGDDHDIDDNQDGKDQNGDNDDNEDDIGGSFVKVEKPELTNQLIFDLDD
ncbi:protein kintoun-like [Dendronephthya gigantea]|uniref:protein kintoun-like n=1 Tax=Dendronephthya gigantea TaxID=151771 RepID=UPI00106DA352|nr:protein kintoun-like [Dendronephthya gigantea]